MLSELPEKNSSPSKNPLWEEERTQELDHSRRVLSQKLKELAANESELETVLSQIESGNIIKRAGPGTITKSFPKPKKL